MNRRKLTVALIVAAITLGAFGAVAQAGSARRATAPGGIWPTFHFSPDRSGVNPSVAQIGAGNVGQLALQWATSLPATADSTPVYTANLLFLTLTNGSTLAVNASTGATVWQATTTGPNFTTSSPTLDPSNAWVYAYGLDGYVHKYATSNGQESIGNGFPAKITNLPSVEKGSSSLNLANGYLYLTTSGYPGDAGHYDGHLVAVNLSTGTSGVFNSLCSNLHVLLTDQSSQRNYCPAVRSGVWARSGAVVDPTTGHVFIATGNGPWNGRTNWGDSVLEISANGLTLIDSYTPADQRRLNSADLDLGSSAPALFPTDTTSLTPYLAAQVGKDGVIRLLNRQNLNGSGHPGVLGGELQTIAAPGTCEVLTAPVVWSDVNGKVWLFVANNCGLNGYNLVTDGNGKSSLVQVWQQSQGYTSPVLGNGVLYAARDNGGAVDARDPATGNLLWSSTQTPDQVGSIHWQSPVILDGLLILPDDNGHLFAFGLPSGS